MKSIAKTILAAAVLAVPGSARAFWFTGGVSGVTGSHSYSGTDIYAGAGGDTWSLKPNYSEYQSDYSTGTYNTLSLRLGYDTGLWGVGVTGGVTPKNAGYSNEFGGVDATLSLSPTGSGPTGRLTSTSQGGNGPSGRGISRIDIGVGATYTRHTDDDAANGAVRASALNIGQTDLKASVGIAVLDNVLAIQGTRSIYDRTMNAGLNTRPALVQNLDGFIATIQGFPESNVNARFTMGMLPLIKPFVQYTRTTYELSAPDTDTYAVGGYVEFGLLEVTATYQRITPATGSSSNFISLGAGLRF